MEVDDIKYRTDGNGSWERLYGESWESEYNNEKKLEEILDQMKLKLMMKKILIISVTILGIVLAIVGGYYAVELVKLMGANLLTVKGVVGCYFISFFI